MFWRYTAAVDCDVLIVVDVVVAVAVVVVVIVVFVVDVVPVVDVVAVVVLVGQVLVVLLNVGVFDNFLSWTNLVLIFDEKALIQNWNLI